MITKFKNVVFDSSHVKYNKILQGNSQPFLLPCHSQLWQLPIAFSMAMSVSNPSNHGSSRFISIIPKFPFLKLIIIHYVHKLSASAGLNHLQFCNLNSFRTLFILGFSSFMAISVPQHFRDYLLRSNSSPLHTSSKWVSLGFAFRMQVGPT